MLQGADNHQRQKFGIQEDIEDYVYLASTDPHVDGMDDRKEWADVMEAMEKMGLNEQTQDDIIGAVATILHLGNISFVESGNEVAQPEEDAALEFPAHLLKVDKELLRTKLTSRIMESMGGKEKIEVTLNVDKAEGTRDALAKAIYYRLFDYLVAVINKAMNNQSKQKLLSIGILDIYGFEIFAKNGFEQFCINFVNEKLQQIFIELTMKSEQVT